MMKIIGTSSEIKIEIEGKLILGKGERSTTGFIVYKSSLTHDNQPCDPKCIEELVIAVSSYCIDKEYKVEFW